MGLIASFHELASTERKFYGKLCNIKTQVIRPLLELGRNCIHSFFHLSFSLLDFTSFSPESLSSALGQASLGVLQTLAGQFGHLCHLTGQHSASLTSNLRRCRGLQGLLILEHHDIFLDSYSEYVCTRSSGCCAFFHAAVFLQLLQRRGELPGDGGLPVSGQTAAVSTETLGTLEEEQNVHDGSSFEGTSLGKVQSCC